MKLGINKIFDAARRTCIFRGEFSFAGPWAISNWGPFWKVCDD